MKYLKSVFVIITLITLLLCVTACGKDTYYKFIGNYSGSHKTEVELSLKDRHEFTSLESYLEAVKYEIDDKESAMYWDAFWDFDLPADRVYRINFSDYYDMSKEEWDKVFQFISDNQYEITSMIFETYDYFVAQDDMTNDFLDINNISGISILSNIESLYIDNNIETELSADFPDLPNVRYLSINTARPDIVIHFPNLESISYDKSTLGTEKAVIENTKCKAGFLFYEMWEQEINTYAEASGAGKIDGKFTISYLDLDKNLEPSYYSGYFNDDKYNKTNGADYIFYEDDYRECKYYVLVTVENPEYWGDFPNGAKAYAVDYYIQIFDVKNKIKYEKVFIDKVTPPVRTSLGRDEKVYMRFTDEMFEFIDEAINAPE
jgi:hypothetical protein